MTTQLAIDTTDDIPTIPATGGLDDVLAFALDYGNVADVPADIADVTFQTIMIDGPLAEALLARNMRPTVGEAGTNRRRIEEQTEAILADILNGRWNWNHQAVAFDTAGKLVDGQHRLDAIVRASKIDPSVSVPVTIAFGIADSSKVDLTRRRSIGTQLQMLGYGSAGHLSAILANLYRYERIDWDRPALDGGLWRQQPVIEEVHDLLKAWPAVKDATSVATLLGRVLPPSGAGAAWTVCRTKYPDAHNNEFVRGVQSGANLAADDPRLALRTWGLNQKALRKRVTAPVAMAVYFKAFQAFREGQPLRLITYRPSTDRFPRP